MPPRGCPVFSFEVPKTSGKARVGRLTTPHGCADTPAFMPVGTAGTVKGLMPDQLRAAGAQIVLANTYHLMLRPGPETVARLGGVHELMGWDGPVLTDSGGYQVFSLAHRRKLSDEGVVFQSHIDGASVALTPQRAIEIQSLLGSDIMMQLDECPPAGAPKDDVATAVRRSLKWAEICRRHWLAISADRQVLFGIQQGGVHADLRAESAAGLRRLDLPGYAVGGLSVGEGHEAMCDVLEAMDEQFPADRPRYLMGVGEPRDILQAVLRGVDMFDCVLPTRNGRNAQAFTWNGRMRLRNAQYAQDRTPLDETCGCYACRKFSRGAIRHYFMAKEMLGPMLVSLHNVHFFAQFMRAIREAIRAGDLEEKAGEWTSQMYKDLDWGHDEE